MADAEELVFSGTFLGQEEQWQMQRSWCTQVHSQGRKSNGRCREADILSYIPRAGRAMADAEELVYSGTFLGQEEQWQTQRSWYTQVHSQGRKSNGRCREADILRYIPRAGRAMADAEKLIYSGTFLGQEEQWQMQRSWYTQVPSQGRKSNGRCRGAGILRYIPRVGRAMADAEELVYSGTFLGQEEQWQMQRSWYTQVHSQGRKSNGRCRGAGILRYIPRVGRAMADAEKLVYSGTFLGQEEQWQMQRSWYTQVHSQGRKSNGRCRGAGVLRYIPRVGRAMADAEELVYSGTFLGQEEQWQMQRSWYTQVPSQGRKSNGRCRGVSVSIETPHSNKLTHNRLCSQRKSRLL